MDSSQQAVPATVDVKQLSVLCRCTARMLPKPARPGAPRRSKPARSMQVALQGCWTHQVDAAACFGHSLLHLRAQLLSCDVLSACSGAGSEAQLQRLEGGSHSWQAASTLNWPLCHALICCAMQEGHSKGGMGHHVCYAPSLL